jgi:hypothetical protein
VNYGSSTTSAPNFAIKLDNVNDRVKDYHIKIHPKREKMSIITSMGVLRSRTCDFKNHNHRDSG